MSHLDNSNASLSFEGLKEAIILLYLDVKIRSNDEIDDYDERDLDKEKQHLFENVNPYEIIEYIKNSIEILLNMKDDDMDELNEKLTKVRQRERG